MFSKQINLYSTRTSRIRFEPDKLHIYTLVENNPFPVVFPKSGILKEDVKTVILPKIRTKYGFVQTSQLKGAYTTAGLTVHTDLLALRSMSKNVVIDLTPAFRTIREHAPKFDTQLAYSVFLDVMSKASYPKTKSEKVLLYLVDQSSPSRLKIGELFISTIIFGMMRKKAIPFSRIFIGFIGKGNSYQKIFDVNDSGNSYQRIISIVRDGISKLDTGALTLSIAHQIGEELDIGVDKVIPIAKTIVEDTDTEDRAALITKINTKPHMMREIAVKAAQKMTGHSVLRDLPLPLKRLEVGTLGDQLPEVNVIDIKEIPHSSDLVSRFDVSPEITPHIIEPMRVKNLEDDDMQKLVAHVVDDAFSTSVSITDSKDFTNMKEMKISLTSKVSNVKQDVKIYVPKLKEDGSFTMFGNRYVLKKQLATLPVAKYKENEVDIDTLMGTITLKRKKVGAKIYIIFNKSSYTEVPLFTYMSALIGAEKLCDLLDINLKKEGNTWTLSPTDQIGGLVAPRTLEDISKEHFVSKIEDSIKNRALVDYLVNRMPKKAIDPSTLKLLQQLKLPTDYVGLLLYTLSVLIKDNPTAVNDLSKRRIRSVEVMGKIILHKLDRAVSRYEMDAASGRPNPLIDIDPNFAMRAMVESGAAESAVTKDNPVSEASQKNKVSFSGLGSFSADNTPVAYRDIHLSYTGIIDPIETDKAKKVGDQLYLTTSPNIVAGSLIVPTKNPESVLGYTSSIIPFIGSSATARVNMGCSHAKQAIPITGAQAPYVMTGSEGVFKDIASEQFITKATATGRVTKVEKDRIEITNPETKVVTKINLIKPNIIAGSGVVLKNVHKPLVAVGNKVISGTVIAESLAFQGGLLAIGRNMLCAYTLYNSANYEDGIIIAEGALDHLAIEEIIEKEVFVHPDRDTIRSMHFTKGKVNQRTLLIEVDSAAFNIAAYEKSIVRLYASDESTLRRIIITGPDKKAIERMLESIDGVKMQNINIRVKPDFDPTVTIVFELEVHKKAEKGDKIGNKHGNKGVINHIIPKSKAAFVKSDKRHVDLFLNPLGVYGRTNWGQYKELLCAALLYEYNQEFAKRFTRSGQEAAIEYFSEAIAGLNKLPEYDKRASRQLNRMKKAELAKLVADIKNNRALIPVYIPPFKDQDYNSLLKLADKAKLLKTIVCPELNREITALVGYVYFHRLEHTANHKVNARSTGAYKYRTRQPVGGKKMLGGQRLGEMETWSIFAHDCPSLMREFKTVQSDEFVHKRRVISEILNGKEPELPTTDEKTSVSQMYRALMLGLHVKV